MRVVHRSSIEPYSVEQMYDLVADVESYPDFLPWCSAARIQSEDNDEVVACLTMSRAGFNSSFTTRNRMDPPHRIFMTLLDGPFTDLEGEWQVEPLGEAGCKLELSMRFTIANRSKDLLMGVAFEHSCNTLVDAFVTRARSMYG